MNIRGKKVPWYKIPKKTAKKIIRCGANVKNGMSAPFYLRRLSQKCNSTDEKISVAFVVQLPEVWEKQAPVFELMLDNERFSICLVIVPGYDIRTERFLEFGAEKRYFDEKYPQCQKIYYTDNMDFFKRYTFEYIFFQRPYNNYLPNELKSSNVVQYSRICYIPYGKETLNPSVQYNDEFFRDVYITFLAGKEEFQFFEKKFVHNRKKGYQKVVWKGYPCFEKCYKARTTSEGIHIIWTPRWSYDSFSGGSHFIEYKDTMFSLKKRFPNIEITIRPHPLMWDNFIKERIMSPKEIEIYHDMATQAGIVFDNENLFADSIKDKTILITDMSSVVHEFFLSGKPIIYCPANLPLNSFYNDILKGMYIANTENDIFHIVEDLVSGNDWMFKKRQEMIKEKYEFLEDASVNILQYILEDYGSRKNEGLH